jgi:hypothetical protein
LLNFFFAVNLRLILEGPGSCLHEPEDGINTMMVREDTNHGTEFNEHALALYFFAVNLPLIIK